MISKKKTLCLFIIAVFIGLLGIVLPDITSSTNNTTVINTSSGVMWVLNTTNLAPPCPDCDNGQNERIQNVTYYANNSPIQLSVYAHANNSGNLHIFLYLNGTLYDPRQSKPVGLAENVYTGIDITIPQYTSYRVNITGYHHYEWREMQILTGNVTTNLTGGGSATCTDCINGTQLSNNMSLKVNKSGDNMTGDLNISANLTVSNNGTTYLKNINNTGAIIEIRNTNHTVGAFSVWDRHGTIPSQNGSFFFQLVNRYWDENLLDIFNASHTERYGSVFIVRGVETDARLEYNAMLPNTSGVGNQINIWRLEKSATADGNMELLRQNGTMRVQNLSGTGNAYVCVDSTGKLYRGSPGC